MKRPQRYVISSPHKRLDWVDAARGIAALTVTVYHFQLGSALARAAHQPILAWINWPGSRLAVPLFFVISGFSIHYAEHEKIRDWVERPSALRSYFSRRLWRIYPPYVAALLLAMAIGWVAGRPTPAADLAVHLLMVHPFFPAYFNSIDVVFWSIGVEMWLYLLYPFALRMLEVRGLHVTGVVVFLVSAASIAATAAVSATVNVVGMWFVLSLFFGWCMGAAVAEGYIRGNLFFLSPRWWVAGTALLAMHLGLYFAGFFAGRMWPVFIPSVVVLSAWGLAIVMILQRKRTTSGSSRSRVFGLLRWLGAISYSLYLVHEPLINLREVVLLHLSSHTLSRVVFCLWYGVPFAAAWLCWRWVEKPSMKISKRLKAALA